MVGCLAKDCEFYVCFNEKCSSWDRFWSCVTFYVFLQVFSRGRKKAAGTRTTCTSKIHSNFRNFRSSIILTLVELLSQWEISFGRVKGKESKRVFSMCPPRQRWCLTRPCRLDNPSGWLDTDDGQNPETLSSRAPNHSMTLAWTIAAKIRMEQRTGEQPNDYNDLKSLLSRSS